MSPAYLKDEQPRPLLHVLDLPATSCSTVDVWDENNRWRFAKGQVSAKNHFWSIDGIECLWCATQRTPEQIAIWFAAGKPKEECR